MNLREVEIQGKKTHGLEVQLPGARLVAAYGDSGFVMCGLLDIETANKLKLAAALVRGVSTVDDLLAAKIQAISNAAAEKGVTLNMTGRDALAKFS